MTLLEKTIKAIKCASREKLAKAWAHLDQLAKPIRSLGVLETLAARIAAMTGSFDYDISKGEVVVFCADNGVCKEGVSSCPQEITRQVTLSFTRGITGVCALARSVGAGLTVIDVGVKDLAQTEGIVFKKVMPDGTNNIAQGPAMTKEAAVSAVEVGIGTVLQRHRAGVRLFATGEVGIGNTTAAAAVLSALSGLSPDVTVGRGAGLDDTQLENKRRIVKKALETNKPDRDDAIDVIAKVGGLDIAGMCGAFLAAASVKAPVVIDGYISCVAALCAKKLCPASADYMIASHLSTEPGAIFTLQELGIEPVLHMHMRLGEGTGAVLMFPIIRAALDIARNMATFSQASISSGEYLDKWAADQHP
ncbi:MAG: nicotinate-nucleotide--dimethylbenzimidazole phosphoribosyltransferase [Bacillota bacterium]|nr:nicotinate-nucleotide--dimethylbenzimidazole phosphoribosyltransferase [Bacillota bacterium]